METWQIRGKNEIQDIGARRLSRLMERCEQFIHPRTSKCERHCHCNAACGTAIAVQLKEGDPEQFG